MKDLFGKEVILPTRPTKQKGERIATQQYKQLTNIYGKIDGKKCGDCKNCQQHTGGTKKFYKCHLATVSNSQATDWNSRWQACGQFDPKYK